MSRLMLVCAAVAGLATALPAAAQFQRPDDAVKYRKGAFQVMANHFGRIGAMVNNRAPYNAAAAAASADVVAFMSRLPFEGFVEGTSGTEKGAPLAKVWTQRAEFDGHARKLQEEASKLAAAAKANNLDALKAAFGATAASCKACHDDFRVQ
jgi:cytochrome c556